MRGAAGKMLLVEILLLIIALVVCAPCAVVFVECLASLGYAPTGKPAEILARPRVAVLIPAHDEVAVIATALESVKAQLKADDRLIVVAHNCTDETASLARSSGAVVIERRDPSRVGKSYALDFGIRYLEADPPEVVICLDADCVVMPGSITRLVEQVVVTERPAQASYLQRGGEPMHALDSISALALLVKNFVRPLGLKRLGLPCNLTGSGMAFPWHVICTAVVANGRLAEDMWLSVDLALAGYGTSFCPEAQVLSQFPRKPDAALVQRTRWEHGHLETWRHQGPRLVLESLRMPRLDLMALALDLMVPPVSLLILCWFAVLMTTFWAGAFGWGWIPFTANLAGGLLLVSAEGIAWHKYARHQISLRTLLMAPIYVITKIPIYVAFLAGRHSAWIGTERE